MAAAIAAEARAQGAHIGYGPVLDLAWEPPWSKVEETYGEDLVFCWMSDAPTALLCLIWAATQA